MPTITTAAYTPLESLLLFQALPHYGFDPAAFAKISVLLTSNHLVKSDETYDAGRLRPDALQDLFLQLLRDELRADEPGANGDASPTPNSRKRKLPTPPLPTLQDAGAYLHRIPALIESLYARYLDNIVGRIRDDEEHYDRVQREIRQLEQDEQRDLERAAAEQQRQRQRQQQQQEEEEARRRAAAAKNAPPVVVAAAPEEEDSEDMEDEEERGDALLPNGIAPPLPPNVPDRDRAESPLPPLPSLSGPPPPPTLPPVQQVPLPLPPPPGLVAPAAAKSLPPPPGPVAPTIAQPAATGRRGPRPTWPASTSGSGRDAPAPRGRPKTTASAAASAAAAAAAPRPSTHSRSCSHLSGPHRYHDRERRPSERRDRTPR